jgi:hypothetical protein
MTRSEKTRTKVIEDLSIILQEAGLSFTDTVLENYWFDWCEVSLTYHQKQTVKKSKIVWYKQQTKFLQSFSIYLSNLSF